MSKQWIFWLSSGIFGGSACLILAALIFAFIKPTEISCIHTANVHRSMPKGSFVFPKAAYDSIGKCALDLKFTPLTMQVPDLRTHLIYYGKNGRPDAKVEKQILHFGFVGNPQLTSISSGERLYLLYDRGKFPAQYVFSPNNGETGLWIEPIAQGNEAHVKVRIKNEKGEEVHEPIAHASLILQEKENLRTSGKTWEMGKWRVDGGLLARQKARWMGPDLFLERHGGEDFKTILGKHRVDFTDEEETYSVFIGLGDSLIWIKDRWKVAQAGDETLEYPLMVVKKIDDRVLNFDLWDIGGKNKMSMNLIRIHETWMPDSIQNSFQFLGARTRSQYIFELNGERMHISPNDWLLQTEQGWIKLTKAREIDDYVERKLTGILFVFDGVERAAGKHLLKGVAFNSSRTEMQEIELSVQKSSTTTGEASVRADDFEDDDEEEEEAVVYKVHKEI